MNLRGLSITAITFSAIVRVVASSGAIGPTLSPPSPVKVGDTFEVIYRMSTYTDSTEIDRFRFGVDYPTELFSLVPNSFRLGDASGADQQWLSKANQESAAQGFILSAANTSIPGMVMIDVLDSGASSPERGTLAASGFLISFRLEAIAEGTGLLRAHALDASGVLFDTAGSVAGMPSFNATIMTVNPNPNPRLRIENGFGNVTISWPAAAGGFVLQSKTNLNAGSLWMNVAATVSTSNGTNYVTVPSSQTSSFYRLSTQ